MSTLDPDQLNRATLQRQMLLRRESATVSDIVRRIVALQAQSPPAPYIALWNRVASLNFDTVDQAYADRSLVKASLMRITLHAVDAADYPAFHSASTPILRAARLNDRRYRSTGLTTEDADRAVPRLLDFLQTPRSKTEILDHFAAEFSDQPRLWWALKTYAPLVHSPTGSPWSFDSDTHYEQAPTLDRPPVDDALQLLVRRYLAGFGPATIADFAQFSLQPMSTARPAFEAIRDELVTHTTIDGDELFDLSDAPDLPDPDTPAPPRLMAMWDSILLAYRDRSRIIPDHYRSHVIRRNGDVLPTVLIDGRVAGVWNTGPDGIKIGALEPIHPGTRDALDDEARRLYVALADRGHNIVGRTGTWWPKLPITSTHQVTP
ncbi:MAG: winged helix DNA-binding domain-containing protein [Acidimicrobiales bacterium]